MKFLKILFVIILLAAAGLLLFLPSEMKITKEITIDAPPKVVYEQISDYHNWMAWSAWHQLDSTMKVEYSEARSGVGAYQTWESEHPKLGVGKMETVETVENERMLQDLYFFDLENPAFQTWFELEKEGENSTKITWSQADSASTFDLQKRLVYLMMAADIESDFESGLENLKNVAEYEFANAKPYEMEIMEKDLPAQFVLAVMDSCSTDQMAIQSAMGNCYQKLGETCSKNSLKTNYTPYAIAHKWDPENDLYVFEAGFELEEKPASKLKNVNIIEVGGGKYVVGILKGSYEHLEAGHGDIDTYMKENGLTATGMPFEKYMDDPMKTPETEVRTMIAYPIG